MSTLPKHDAKAASATDEPRRSRHSQPQAAGSTPHLAQNPTASVGLPVQTPKVFNLTVLVREVGGSTVSARAANLSLPDVSGSTIREVLSTIVTRAKQVIAENDDSSTVPWVDPPATPLANETRFVVPLHL